MNTLKILVASLLALATSGNASEQKNKRPVTQPKPKASQTTVKGKKPTTTPKPTQSPDIDLDEEGLEYAPAPMAAE